VQAAFCTILPVSVWWSGRNPARNISTLPTKASLCQRGPTIIREIEVARLSRILCTVLGFEIRADERFRDIPIPKLVGLGRPIRIRRQIEFFVGTHEKKVEVLLRPARPDLGPIFRLSFAERIRLHGEWVPTRAKNEDIGFVSSRGSELAHRL
jgi:hypothetical protein